MRKLKNTVILTVLIGTVTLSHGCVDAPVQGIANGVTRSVQTVVEDTLTGALLNFLNRP